MPDPNIFQAPIKFCPFQYGEVKIKEATYIMGTPYLTRRAIGEWLGYKKPQEAIDKIIRRNPHIENPQPSVHPKLGCTHIEQTWSFRSNETPWAVPLNLRATDGKNYSTTIYSPIGLQLIVFESRQPRAIAYKIAVARLVNDIMTGEYNRRLARAFLRATGRDNK